MPTQPVLLETSKTKPVLVRDPLQWPNNSRGVFQKAIVNGSLYFRYSIECFAACCNTRKHKIAWLHCPIAPRCPLVIGQFAFTFPFGLRWHFWILCGHIYSIIISLMKRRLENYSTVVGCPGWLKIVSFLVVIGCHIPAPDLLIRLVTIFRQWIKTPITGVHLKLKL